MPLPIPEDNEKRKDFLARCISDKATVGEFPEPAQRIAACTKQFDKDKPVDEKPTEKLKLETKGVKNVEVFQTGTWKGNTWKEADLDQMVENFEAGVLEPYVNINHSAQDTKAFKEALKTLSLGFVSELKREGKKLIANFKQVPKTIAELIEAGALKKKSCEIWKTYILSNGQKRNNVLEAVSFFGANGVPAVNTLSDFVNLYKNQLSEFKTIDNTGEKIILENSDQEVSMDEVKIERIEYDALVAVKQEFETFKRDKENASLVELKNDNDAMKTKLQSLETENKDLQKFKVASEKKAVEDLKVEGEKFTNDQIQAKKILPAHSDSVTEMYIMLKTEKPEMFEAWKKEIEDRKEVFGEPITSTEPSDPNKISLNTDEDVSKAAKTYQAQKGCDYNEALEHVLSN